MSNLSYLADELFFQGSCLCGDELDNILDHEMCVLVQAIEHECNTISQEELNQAIDADPLVGFALQATAQRKTTLQKQENKLNIIELLFYIFWSIVAMWQVYIYASLAFSN
jgi:hypothetical protein